MVGREQGRSRGRQGVGQEKGELGKEQGWAKSRAEAVNGREQGRKRVRQGVGLEKGKAGSRAGEEGGR